MPTQASPSTLVSLAMLTERINSGGHYLDNFTPFIRYIIRGTEIGKAVDEENIQQGIKDQFGLFIPKHSITLLLGRLVKSKILKRANREFLLQKNIEEDLSFESNRADLERSMTEVVNGFMSFSQSEHEYELNTDRAYEIILGFLSEFSIECLAAYERNTPFPVEVSKLQRKEQVLIASFFKYLQMNSAGRFRRFSEVVKGYMFMNSILCPDLTEEKFSKTTFYLDTPILINALGLNGDRGKRITSEMTKILRDKEGTIRIFDHTRDELSNFIMWLADHGTDPAVLNPAAVEMRRRKQSRADMILFHNRHMERLQSMGIRMENTPSFDRENFPYQIDENELQSILKDEVNYIQNPNAVIYDVNSVRAIHVLRRGMNPAKLENTNAVFVTSNNRFAKVIKRYESMDRPRQAYRVPSVVTDIDVTTVAWLKSSMASEIPEQHLVANVYAMLKPGEAFGAKILQVAERLLEEERVSQESLLLLRSDISLIERYNEEKLGDLSKAESPEDIEIFLRQQDLERSAKLRNLQDSNTELQERISEKIRHEETTKNRQSDRINSIARVSAWVTLAFAALFIIPIPWIIFEMAWVQIVSNILSLLGLTIPKIHKWISSKIANFLKKKILGDE